MRVPAALFKKLELARGNLLRGRRASAADHTQEVLELSRSARHAAAEAEALQLLGDVARSEGRLEEALVLYRQALGMAERHRSLNGIAANESKIGVILESLARYGEAQDQHERALAIWRGLGDPSGIAASSSRLGVVRQKLGHYEEAEELQKEALELSRGIARRPANECLHLKAELVEVLNRLGSLCRSHVRYEQARALHEEALEVSERSGLRAHAAATLSELGNLELVMGHYVSSAQLHERALAIRRSLETPKDVAHSASNLGVVFRALGRHDEALSLHREALALRRQLGLLEGTADSLANLATVLQARGEYEEALEKQNEALGLRRNLGLPEATAASLNNLGSLHKTARRYREALAAHQEALALRRRLGLTTAVAASLSNLANVERAIGRYEEALGHHEEALELRRKLGLAERVAMSLNNSGKVYFALGRFDQALQRHSEALAIYRHMRLPRRIASSLNNLGLGQQAVGLYADALDSHREALSRYRAHGTPDDIAASLNNQGLLLEAMGRLSDAESRFREALDQYRQLGTPSLIAGTLVNLGDVQRRQGEALRAESTYIEAESALTGSGLRYHYIPGRVELALENQRPRAALAQLDRVQLPWNVGAPARQQFGTLRGIALLLQGELAEATRELLGAVQLIEEMRHSVTDRTGFLRSGRGGGRVRAYRALLSALAEQALREDVWSDELGPYGDGFDAAAFFFAEAGKARALLESVADGARRDSVGELPEGLRGQQRGLVDQLRAIDEEWDEAFREGPRRFSSLKERQRTLRSELEGLVEKISKDHPRYAALHYPTPVTVDRLPIATDELLLELAVGEGGVYLFAVGGETRLQVHKVAEDIVALRREVGDLLRPLQEAAWDGIYPTELANRLYRNLLEPVTRSVSSEVKLIIIPDDFLAALPFEALVVEIGRDLATTTFMGDVWHISYAPSASALALSRALGPAAARRPLFALGDPDFGLESQQTMASPGPHLPQANTTSAAGKKEARPRAEATTSRRPTSVDWKPLPETEHEVRVIADLFGVKVQPPDVLLGARANEGELRSVPLSEYRRLHFATHADLPGQVPDLREPFLVLAGARDPIRGGGDDGFLTYSEVLDLTLDAELVVLSACSTGRGQIYEGEGVMSLARAFQHAGSRRVVMSLWQVRSDVTVDTMIAFYRALKTRPSPGSALNTARKEIRAERPHPYFWAPFVLYGDWRGDAGSAVTSTSRKAPIE
ncbi:MAG: CHAT domain-containing protein [bacterium]|nr:CHAT domain-containing protein [bacterium]